MPTTDAQLQKQQEKVQRLREQVVEATQQREQAELGNQNDIVMQQLKEEEGRLQAELTLQKDVKKENDPPLVTEADQSQYAEATSPVEAESAGKGK